MATHAAPAKTAAPRQNDADAARRPDAAARSGDHRLGEPGSLTWTPGIALGTPDPPGVPPSPARTDGSSLREPRFGRDFSHVPAISSGKGVRLMPKLAVSAPNDPLELEADRVADSVLSGHGPSQTAAMGNTAGAEIRRSCACGGASDEECTCGDQMDLHRAAESADGPTLAPPSVGSVLAGSGQLLPDAVRADFEPRFGRDFSHVRVHTSPDAAASARDVHALAYTVGSDIVFSAGQYVPSTASGRRLLAHELAHVVQDSRTVAPKPLHRFHIPHGVDPKHQYDETADIAATFADMESTIKAMVATATVGTGWGATVNMDLLVQLAGGSPASKELDKKFGTNSTPKVKSALKPRYLFTCRCGLIDMRHFLQMMYMSNFAASAFLANGNRYATRKGREHELTSESESRFGPEDTPSNAMGALLGSGLAVTPRPVDLVNAIVSQLSRCDPLGFDMLSPASKDTVKHFYGDLKPDPAKPADLIPVHQNETAVPEVPAIPECSGREQSFPFMVEEDDRKTLSSTAFDKGASGLTGDSDIRDFIATQRPEVIKALSGSEKVRLVRRLFKGWVADEDLDAIEVIYKNSTAAEKTSIKTAISPDDLSGSQRTRLRAIFTL